MIASLLQRLKGDLALALMRTFVARGFAAVGGVLLFVVLGRLYGAEGVGVFALAQSIYLGAGILARYGMDNALMRYVGQDPTASVVPVYLRMALTKSALLSTVAAVIVFLLRDQFARWFDAPMLGIVLPGIALAIPPFTVAFVLAGFMKGIRKPATACLLENGIISLITVGILLGANIFLEVNIASIGWIMAIAAWLVFGLGFCQIILWFRDSILVQTNITLEYKQFKATSNVFFTMTLAELMQTVITVMIAGVLLNSSELGMLKVAERIALLISFILAVINGVLPPVFAKLYNQGNTLEISKIARKGVQAGLILTSPVILVCLIAPSWVLSHFGAEFCEASTLLRIIVLAQAFNVATGSVGFILNMTGNARLMRNISLICNAFGVGIILLLVPRLGPMGAIVALSFTLIIQKSVALYFVWEKLQIWPIPLIRSPKSVTC